MKIQLNIGTICEMVEGTTSLDHSFMVENITSLSQATPADLAVVLGRGDASVFDEVGREELEKSNAGVILAASPVVFGKQYVLVKDPLRAYQALVEKLFVQKSKNNEAMVHPSAIVHEQAELAQRVVIDPCAVIQRAACIGQATTIGSQVFVGKNCVIGSHVVLHPGVKVLDNCVIGDHTIVHAGTVIGSDGFGYQVTKQGMLKIPQIGSVRIGSWVEIGANCSIDRDSFNQTIINDGVKIDNNVHIAHGVNVGPHTAILAHTAIAGGVTIGTGCQIGGQVGIKDHVRIGNGVKIVGQSAVLKDVSDGQIIAGSPSVPFSTWKRIMVVLPRLPELTKKAKKLEQMVQQRHTQGFWKRLFGG